MDFSVKIVRILGFSEIIGELTYAVELWDVILTIFAIPSAAVLSRCTLLCLIELT